MYQTIKIDTLELSPYALFGDQWLVLAAGDFRKNHFNAMTIAWGSLGCMWNKPFIQVVVRPGRYTHEFMESYDTFTVSAFPANLKPALNVMGTKSGRNCDKIKESGLTPMASQMVFAPSFKEADLIFECKKLYRDVLKPEGFFESGIDKNYPAKDYHTVYFGEIVTVLKKQE